MDRYTTVDINVKELLPKGLPKIQDGVLALNNKKTVAEIKDLEWNSKTKVSTIFWHYVFIIITNCLCVL